MAPRVTLKDVARKTGLSESAVSQVLNGRPCRLSEASKERIREVARELDYRPNRAARGLATRRSDAIGLIVPDIENPFFSSLAKRVEACCREAGFGLFITNSDDRSDYDCEQLRRLDALGVDGIVFVPSDEILAGAAADELARALKGLSVPFVMVDRVIDAVPCDKVCVDNAHGAYLGVSHLLDQGHVHVGCLACTERSQNGRLRLAGYRRALAERGIPEEGALVAECDYHGESAYAATDALVAAGATAIFSTSDLMTVGVLRRLSERGLAVPGDVSVVSFDRSESSALYLPDMTAVRQDVGELATRAFGLLTARISGDTRPPELSVVVPELVVGTSVAAPRA